MDKEHASAALTPAQEAVYDAISVFQREYNYTPSTRELGRFMGRGQKTVQIHICAIIDKERARRINDRHIELL
jgi:hypothetical protein